MGKASISINIGALWNGSAEIEKVKSSLNSLAKVAAQSSNKAISDLAKQGTSWVDLGNQIYNVGTRISNVGQALTSAITEPMVSVGTYCVAQAETFDTALANLNKTANLTAAELEDFGEAAIEASKTSPVTSDDILNAEALGAQLGISTENLQDFATVATGLDISTNMGLEEASTEMARFLNIMNESDDAVSNYGSTIVALGNNYATTESEIANMAERLAGASANTKLTSQDVLGLAAAMSSLGIKAEAGGSSMTTIFNNMSSAVAKGGDQLQAYADIAGISAEEFAQAWGERPIEVFEQMIENTHNMVQEGGNLTETLDAWGVSGIRQTDVMQRLINNGTILTEAVSDANSAWEENTALTTEVNKRNQSLESRFQTLANNANAAAITVGEVLGEQLLNLADKYLMPALDGLNDMATAFKNLDTPAQTAITTIGLLAAAAGPVLTVAGKLVQVVGNVTSAVGKAQQGVSVFASALTDTDGAILRNYAGSKNLTTQLSLNGNAAVRAAGDVDTYVKTWESMVDAEKKVNQVQQQQSNIQLELLTNTKLTAKQKESLKKTSEKLAQTEINLNSKISQGIENYEKSASSTTKWTGTTKEAQKAIELTGKSSESLTTSLSTIASSMESTSGSTITLGSSLKGLASSAGSMLLEFAKANAVTIAVTALAAAIGFIAEKCIEAKEKQELLSDVSQTAGSIFDKSRSSAQGYGDAIGELEIDVDGTLTKIQELNSSITDTTTELAVNNAKVDQYLAVMQELGNKSSLTATEQWKLQQAVEGYNEVTGSAYELTDDYKIALEGENGLVQVSTDEINANAEAWRAKAEAQAYASKAAEYMEAEVEAEMQLKQAQEQLSSAQERYNELKEKGNERTVAENLEINKLASTTIPELETQVSDLTTAYDSAAASTDYLTAMSEIASSSLSDGLKTTLEGLPSTAATSAAEIADNFQAGIQANAITEEQAEAFTQAFIAYMQALPEESQADGAATAAALSQAIANNTVDVTTAVSQLEQLTQQELAKLETDATTSGTNAGNNYATSLSNQSINAKTAGTTVASSAASGANTSVSKLQSIGLAAGDGYDTSLSSKSGGAQTAGSKLSSSAESGANTSVSKLQKAGSDAGNKFTTAVGDKSSNAKSSGSKLASSAKSGATSWDATSSGSHLGSQFASGLGSVWGEVKNKAYSLAAAAKAALGFSVPKEGPWSGAEKGGVTSGMHLGQNFAAGMMAAVPTVASAANSLAGAAALNSSYSANFGGAYGGAVSGYSRTVTNNYTLNISGTALQNSSAKVQEALQVLVDELVSASN